MNIVRQWKYADIEAVELGFSPIGSPLMTVCLYRYRGTLIDSGQSRMRSTVLEWIRTNPVNTILLTHHHEDHSGNAAEIARRYGAEILAHPLTLEKMSGPNRILPYQKWVWGPSSPISGYAFADEIETDGLCLIPIHTPGHSKDHCVFLVPDKGWLFSGDLYLGDRIKYFRSDECIGEQIASIRDVLTFDFDVLLCSHHPRLKNGKRHLKRKLQFLEDFCGNVHRLKGEGKPLRVVARELEIKETWLVRGITLGNVSMRNMIVSAWETCGDFK